MLEEVKFIGSNCPFLAVHQKSSHERSSLYDRNSRGKEALLRSHEQKLPVAPRSGSDPVWVSAGGSTSLGHGWKPQENTPQPLMVSPGDGDLDN